MDRVEVLLHTLHPPILFNTLIMLQIIIKNINPYDLIYTIRHKILNFIMDLSINGGSKVEHEATLCLYNIIEHKNEEMNWMVLDLINCDCHIWDIVYCYFKKDFDPEMTLLSLDVLEILLQSSSKMNENLPITLSE